MKNRFERLDPASPLNLWSKLGLVALAGAFVVFFGLTLKLEAFSPPGKGDLDVYLRAAWAAREGTSLYAITDDHDWHYTYPPLFACLAIPLADPPHSVPAAARVGVLPFWASATIWYWLSAASIAASLHILAGALEKALGARGPRFSHAWWALRTWPLVVCLLFAGDGIGRGQATPFIMLFLSVAGAAILRGRRLVAGFSLGFVGVMKLFPLYLLLYPVRRRDVRMLIGAVAGLAAGVLLPVAIMGPSASFAAYHELLDGRLVSEANLVPELHATNGSIQSFEYMAYNTLNPVPALRASSPPRPYFLFHLAVSAIVTVAALLLMSSRGEPIVEFLNFSALILLAIPILPVSRPNYFLLGAIPFAGLLAEGWTRNKGLWPGWPVASVGAGTLAISALAIAGPHLALDLGLITYAGLAMALLALLTARRLARPIEANPTPGGLPGAGPSEANYQPR